MCSPVALALSPKSSATNLRLESIALAISSAVAFSSNPSAYAKTFNSLAPNFLSTPSTLGSGCCLLSLSTSMVLCINKQC